MSAELRGPWCLLLGAAESPQAGTKHHSSGEPHAKGQAPGEAQPTRFQCGKLKDEHQDKRFCKRPEGAQGRQGASQSSGGGGIASAAHATVNSGRKDSGMALSEGGMPLGCSEAAYVLPGSMPSPAPELLRYMTGQAGLESVCAEVASGRASLHKLYDRAAQAGLASVVSLWTHCQIPSSSARGTRGLRGTTRRRCCILVVSQCRACWTAELLAAACQKKWR